MHRDSRGEGGDPLERLMAQLEEISFWEPADGMETERSGDPLKRLGAWISAARDLSSGEIETDGVGVLGELLGKIAAARVIEPAERLEELGLSPVDSEDPRATIARWIQNESAQVGGMKPIVRLRPVADEEVAGTGRLSGEVAVEAAIGRAVLGMIADTPLRAESRQQAVRLLSQALENPSTEALQAVMRVLITDS